MRIINHHDSLSDRGREHQVVLTSHPTTGRYCAQRIGQNKQQTLGSTLHLPSTEHGASRVPPHKFSTTKKRKNGRETAAITRRHSAIEQPHVSRPKNTFFPNTLALTAKQVGTEHPRPPPPHQLLGAKQPAVFRLILNHRRISQSSRRRTQSSPQRTRRSTDHRRPFPPHHPPSSPLQPPPQKRSQQNCGTDSLRALPAATSSLSVVSRFQTSRP